MNSLSELLYKLNKYQILLQLNDNNKEAYQKKIYSYTNKINNMEQIGGLKKETSQQLESIFKDIKALNVEALESHYNTIVSHHTNI